MGVKGDEVAMPPATALMELKAGGPLQVASLGPYRLKVTVPVGAGPPPVVRVAVSVTEPPRTSDDFDTWVEREGVPGTTVISRLGMPAATKPLTEPVTCSRAFIFVCKPAVPALASVGVFRTLKV